MLVKAFIVALVVAIVAFVSFPYWASCNLKYDVCLSICDVRHFNSGIEKAACKGGCTTKKIACLTKQVIEPSTPKKESNKLD